jgi:hypothetical protein
MIRTLTLAVALVLGTAGAQAATLLDFSFSFKNNNGNVNGTVTGIIYGLQDNTNGQAAVDVVITSAPVELGNVTYPFSAMVAVVANTFDVSNGQITGSYFFSAPSPFPYFALNRDYGSGNRGSTLFSADYSNSVDQLSVGSAVTYALISNPVPEPSAFAPLAAVLGLALLRIHRRTRA